MAGIIAQLNIRLKNLQPWCYPKGVYLIKRQINIDIFLVSIESFQLK
jgi:hypothetical protein